MDDKKGGMMEHVPVQSTNIRSVGYDPETRTMQVQFSHGGLYSYSNVDPGVHQALVEAPSVGAHFTLNIRNNYAGERIGG